MMYMYIPGTCIVGQMIVNSPKIFKPQEYWLLCFWPVVYSMEDSISSWALKLMVKADFFLHTICTHRPYYDNHLPPTTPPPSFPSPLFLSLPPSAVHRLQRSWWVWELIASCLSWLLAACGWGGRRSGHSCSETATSSHTPTSMTSTGD